MYKYLHLCILIFSGALWAKPGLPVHKDNDAVAEAKARQNARRRQIYHTNRLRMAIMYGNITNASKALAQGADAYDSSSHLYAAPAAMAVFSNNTDIIALILDWADTNEATKKFLKYAISYNRPDIVERLLKRGADPNATTDEGTTMLMYAAASNRGEIIDLLIQHNADVNYNSPWGTALLQAALFQHTEIVGQLLWYGADSSINLDRLHAQRPEQDYTRIISLFNQHRQSLQEWQQTKLLLDMRPETSGETKKYFFDAAVYFHDMPMLAHILANGYRPNKSILSQRMPRESKKLLERYFSDELVLYALKHMANNSSSSAENLLGLLPNELIQHLLGALAYEQIQLDNLE